MKVIEQTPIRLTLRSYPWNAWIVGCIWIAIGTYFLTIPQLSVMVIGTIALVIGLLYFLLFATIETCYFDKTLGIVTLTIKGLYVNKIIEYPIGAIASVEVDPYKIRSQGHTRVGYRTVIVMKNRDRFPLTITYKPSRKKIRETVKIIQEFLQLDASPTI